MASTDARPVPIKNTAYRLTFPIYKSDGTLITGATALDSEVSKDAGTFTDCTNEATEIATSSGVYYLDLSSTEMNADCVAVVVKTSSTGAVPPTFILYPQESGDIKVDMQSVAGTSQTARDIGASVLLSVGTGTGQVNLSSGAVPVKGNVKKNTALAAFPFMMTDSTNHAPATGKTVTVTRSIDGGAFAAGTLSAVTEVGVGIYKVDFGAGDLNGDTVILRATATACDDTFERIVTFVA
jgi:hypothetical protein